MPNTILLTKAALVPGFFPGNSPQHTWPLRVTAVSSIEGLSSKIFVYHAALGNDPYEGDTFECTASVQQMTEVPADAAVAEFEGRSLPYYRKAVAEYNCRSEKEFDELWEGIQQDVQALIDNFRAFAAIQPVDTVTLQ